MGLVKVSMVLAISMLGSVSAMAAPVLPSVSQVSFVPVSATAGARIGAGGRVGAAHARGHSDLGAAAGLGALALLGGTVAIIAATSGDGSTSDAVSP